MIRSRNSFLSVSLIKTAIVTANGAAAGLALPASTPVRERIFAMPAWKASAYHGDRKRRTIRYLEDKMYPETYTQYTQSAFPSLEATMLFGQYGFGTLALPRESACIDRYHAARPCRRKESRCICRQDLAAIFFGRPKCI